MNRKRERASCPQAVKCNFFILFVSFIRTRVKFSYFKCFILLGANEKAEKRTISVYQLLAFLNYLSYPIICPGVFMKFLEHGR